MYYVRTKYVLCYLICQICPKILFPFCTNFLFLSHFSFTPYRYSTLCTSCAYMIQAYRWVEREMLSLCVRFIRLIDNNNTQRLSPLTIYSIFRETRELLRREGNWMKDAHLHSVQIVHRTSCVLVY